MPRTEEKPGLTELGSSGMKGLTRSLQSGDEAVLREDRVSRNPTTTSRAMIALRMELSLQQKPSHTDSCSLRCFRQNKLGKC